MGYRITALMAVTIAMAMTDGPAVGSTWLPSWLDNFVNGTASSTELSSKTAQAPPARASRVAKARAARSPTTAAEGRVAARGESARCLASAAAVRQAQPKAWPKWTYGAGGERCWYAGAKPVFAKRHQHRTRLTRTIDKSAPVRAYRPASFASRPAPPVIPESDGRSTEPALPPAPQPWALEHRWEGSGN